MALAPAATLIPHCRSGFIWQTFGSLWSRGYTPQGDFGNLLLAAIRCCVNSAAGIVRLLGPGGPGMVRSAMVKRFPGESPEVLECIAPYLYQVTAAPGSGEYALNLLLEPGAWSRRPLCERLLNLQGSAQLDVCSHAPSGVMSALQCPSPSFTAAETGWIRSMCTILHPGSLCRRL